MNKKIKSAVSSIALLSILGFASLNAIQPKPANALVGLVGGNLAYMIVGGSLTGLGATMFSVPFAYYDDNEQCLKVLIGTGGGLTLLGLVILDNSGSASFGDLTTAQADRAGLTDGERIAYASERPEINAVLQSNQAERMAEFKATGKVSVENSKADWMNESSSLSPEAFSAIQKIAAAAMNHE